MPQTGELFGEETLPVQYMPRCQTCRHWKFDPKKDTYSYDKEICQPVDVDTGQPMQMPFEVRICKHPAQTFAERPVEQNGFGLVDGSEYCAVLVTAADFGCVRHQPLEEDNVGPTTPVGS